MLTQQPLSNIPDADLLARFMRPTGKKGSTAADTARAALAAAGSLRELSMADAPPPELLAALEIAKRVQWSKLERAGPLTSPRQTYDYLSCQLRDQPREVFAVIYLDNRHHALHYDELFYGTLNAAIVHPREVVKAALKHNAAAVILSHNHPSGVAEPSQSDITLTIKLKEALALVDIRLLDHLVIGDGEFVSLSDRGLF